MYTFSRAVHSKHSEDIRLLMGKSSGENMISFAAGMPNKELFPVHQIEDIHHQLSEEVKKNCFQYGPAGGYPPLINAVGKRLSDKGLRVETEKIMITTGSLQAISILTQEFVNEGDVILTEKPCFVGALSVFETYGAKIIGIPMDEHGIDIEALKKVIEEVHSQPKFLYVTPNFHNPAGIIYSVERRRALLETLSGTDILLLEDDAYGDLYFNKEDKGLTAPIKSYGGYDVEVVYTGSLSKILGPGFRLGYMLSSLDIFDKAEIIKQALDACTSNFTQILACEFLSGGYLEPYLTLLRNEYGERKQLLHSSLKKHLPSNFQWVEPKGGFYIWLRLPSRLSVAGIFRDCLNENVAFVSGRSFDPEYMDDNHLRLSYSYLPKDSIENGVKLLAQIIRRHLENG